MIRTWHTYQAAGYECAACRQPYPCPTITLLDALDAEAGRNGGESND